MRWIVVLVVVLATACGGPSTAATARTGPDVVTAEWTSGDDAPLTPP